MIIVLEGAVCAGKTSIWKDLQKEYPEFVYFEEVAKVLADQGYQLGNESNARTEDCLLEVYMNDFQEAHRRSVEENSICVLDRSYISKLTYDFVRMFETSFDDWSLINSINVIKDVLKHSRPDVYIYLDLDIEEATRRSLEKKRELQTTLDRFWFKQLKNAYELFFSSIDSIVPIRRIDANEKYDNVKENVIALIKQLLREQSLR